MTLKRFLTTFMRVQSSAPEETMVRFTVDDKAVTLLNLEFDAEANVWIIRLRQHRD
jgi:hypothetical protein